MTEPTPRLITSLNRPHYNVRFIRSFRALDREAWRLSIQGIVSGPSQLSYQDMRTLLPASEWDERMVCVEGWSFRAKWKGFTLQDLLGLVQPDPSANYVHFSCADGYYEILSMDDLLEPRVFFAYDMDDQELSDEHGWPLRLNVPPRYGYKGPKSIVEMTFSSDDGKGFWSTVGPYTADGFIEARIDRPQDLPGQRFRTVAHEEQTY